jgi:hypothetical protein
VLDKKLLTLVGSVGGANVLITILASLLVGTTVVGPVGPSGSNGEIGASGSNGQVGASGQNGQTPYIGENGNWWIGSSDTGVSAGGTTNPVDESFVKDEYNLLTDSLAVEPLAPFSMDTAWNVWINPTFTPVSNQDQLLAMVDGGSYILSQDIVLTSLWTPLGLGSQMSVQLDGNGFSIIDLVIDSTESNPVGLFSSLDDSIIFDLTFENADIDRTNTISDTGILAGAISNSWLKNIVIEDSNVNGIRETGLVAGSISDSELSDIFLNQNTLTATSNSGGISKLLTSSKVRNVNVFNLDFEPNFILSRDTEGLSDQSDLGGLFGTIGMNTQISNVSIDDLFMDFVNDSYYVGQNLVNKVGGLIGKVDGQTNYDSITHLENIVIEYAFISANSQVGGIIGYVDSASLVLNDVQLFAPSTVYAGYLNDAEDVVNVNNLTATNMESLGSYVGGLIGQTDGTGVLIMDAFTDANLVGSSYVGGFIGFADGEQDEDEFVYIKNSLSNNNIRLTTDYGGGFVGRADNLEYVIVENAGNHSEVLGYNYFSENFASDVGGFFGTLYEIDLFALISNAYNQGDVIGSNNVGGFVGYNEIEGLDDSSLSNGGLILYNTYNSGNISGSDDVGGFVGEQYDQTNILEIYNSFQAGTLYVGEGGTPDFSSEDYGGFIGDNDASRSEINIFNSFYLAAIDDEENVLFPIGYDGSNSFSSLPTTGFINILISGANGEGNSFALNSMDIFEGENNFYFEDLWDFEEAWTFEGNIEGFPTLIHTFDF